MGYVMSQRSAEFFIAAEHRADALGAMKRLAHDPAFREWYDGEAVEAAHDLAEALAACAWSIESDDGRNAVAIAFHGDKSAREELIFQALAPFVRTGSYIEMVGEDHSIWRFIFADRVCREVPATITWPA